MKNKIIILIILLVVNFALAIINYNMQNYILAMFSTFVCGVNALAIINRIK